jgi:integrase
VWVPTRAAWGARVDTAAAKPVRETFKFHSLRHTFASLMIAADTPAKRLQTLMGHKSITTTLDTHGHLCPGAEQAAIDRFERLIEEQRAGLGPSGDHDKTGTDD